MSDVTGLSAEPINAMDLAEPVPASAGAVVSFEGRVRATNDGRPVTRLHYDAYPEMAASVFSDILHAARDRYDVLSVRVLHRTGTLDVGDVAVAVAVSAAHRGPAFDAARFVMEAVKADLPVWKREHYEDGSSRWLGEAPPQRVEGS